MHHLRDIWVILDQYGYFQTNRQLFQMEIPEAYRDFTVQPMTDPEFYKLSAATRITKVNNILAQKRELLAVHREEEPPVSCVFHWGWEAAESVLETEVSQLLEVLFVLWRERMGEIEK